MYKFNGNIIKDGEGAMTGESPAPDYVADVVSGLYKEANTLSKAYNIIKGEYTNETDFYILLADLEEALDDVDMDEIKRIRDAYTIGTIYSKVAHWIIPALCSLKPLESDIVNKDSLVEDLRRVVDNCEYVPMTTMQVYASELYSCIAAMYNEIFNTYELFRFLPLEENENAIKDLTIGFNEFLIRVNKSPEEMAEEIFKDTQVFVFVTNEVDKDPEISKKIRSMVPDSLKDAFEESIEYITEDQVNMILSGQIVINQAFINALGDDSFEDTDMNDDFSDFEVSE